MPKFQKSIYYDYYQFVIEPHLLVNETSFFPQRIANLILEIL